MEIDKYETQSDGAGLVFTFISIGKRDIVKLVRYDKENIVYTTPDGTRIEAYNLGFGDKEEGSFRVDDKARSNNGDMFIVFNTVLHTIPIFYSKLGNAAIHVRGADDIRHRAYDRFIDKRYDELIGEYLFYGSVAGVVTEYERGTIYDYIIVLPKMYTMKRGKLNIARTITTTLAEKRMLQEVIDNVKDMPLFEGKKAAIKACINVEESKKGTLKVSFE